MKLQAFLSFLLVLGAGASCLAAQMATPASKELAFEVRHYELPGNTLFTPEEVERIMREAIGTNVNLSQIRAALVRLQEAYRERGYPRASVTLPRQSLSDGIVKVDVVQEAELSKPQTYGVQHFEVRGNSVLSAEDIDRVLGPVAGPAVSLEQLHEGLARLQALYRSRGRARASVLLPKQVLAGGLVLIVVDEGPALPGETASLSSTTKTETVPPVEHTFEVRRYEVSGNTLLASDVIDSILTNATGTAVSLPQIQKVLGELQLAYVQRGYATVSVGLPRQQLTNATVKVQVTEGVLADIRVSGNHYYSSDNVRRALPSLTTNVLLNTKWFQAELDQANANQDRQIYPVIGPGPDPGTSALTLRVKDRLPLHGHVEINNKATPDTPPLRIDTAVQYNNLWQYDHQLGLEYNFSPQDLKVDDQLPKFFSQPKVASYSGFYRIPLGFGKTLRENYENRPVDFGYDPVAKTFRLPPPNGNPELIAYASQSASETPTHFGPLTVITNTDLADITSRFTERDLTVNGNVGLRFTLPLKEFYGVRSSFSIGADFKNYDAKRYSTNLTYYDLYSQDTFGNRTLDRQDTIPQDSNSGVYLYYIPLSAGWSASRSDRAGSSSFNFTESLFLAGLASDRARFQGVAGSTKTGGNYATMNAGFTREENLPRDWSILFRANGQWASSPLISNEQFGLGGTAGVRGYQEGEEYGDAGWRALLDLRAPPIGIGYLPGHAEDLPVKLRCSTFLDYGERYLLDPLPSVSGRVQMLGTGLGFYATAGERLDARLILAWALLNTARTSVGAARAYFSMGLQF